MSGPDHPRVPRRRMRDPHPAVRASAGDGDVAAGTAPIRRAVRAGLETVPNLLGITRLVSAPALVWLIATDRLDAAFLLFLLAGASDAIDGPIARRLGVASRFGAILDPLADKAVMAAVYVTGGVCGLIPFWLAGLVVLRDLLILFGGVRLFRRAARRPIRPLRISKTNTGIQIAYAALILFDRAHGLGVGHDWRLPAALFVAASTIVSGLAYARTWWRIRRADAAV